MLLSWLSNLRVRFLLLVLVALLPALGLLILTANEQRDEALATARNDARRVANLAAADQGRVIESTRQLLVVLARVPEVRGGGEPCATLLADLLEQYPLYTNLGVIGPDGMLACTAVPFPDPLDLSDRVYFQGAVATGDFAVGEYQVSRVTGEPGINAGYPMVDGAGTLIGVVYAAIGLDSLGEFAAEAQLSEGEILTVYDRNGRVLVRRPDAENLVGQSLVGTPVVDTILSQGSGVAEGRENDQRYLYAFSSLGGAEATNAYLSIAIPRANVVARAEETFNSNLTRLGLVVLVVLVAAWVGGDLLVRRSTDAHKAVVRRVYDAFHTGGVDLLDEAVAPDFCDNDPMPDQAPGLVGLKQAVGRFRAAFPDGEMVVDELVAEGNKVVARVTLRGTHTGEYGGVPPSGRPARADGVEVYRIAGGKVVEGWSRFAPLVPDTDDGDDGVTTPAAEGERAEAPGAITPA